MNECRYNGECDYKTTPEMKAELGIASSGNSDLLSRVEIVLPKITDELWEMFGETQLMTWDKANNRPHWTQDAVDIAAYLEIRERASR